MSFAKETRFRMTVEMGGETKTFFPTSVEQKERNLRVCREKGYKVLECSKLYPFSVEKNGHNFFLIHNVCLNRMYAMESGELPMNEAEYERLSERLEQMNELLALPRPIAWLSFSELEVAREIATEAILFRQERCVEAGRPELVPYCA